VDRKTLDMVRDTAADRGFIATRTTKDQPGRIGKTWLAARAILENGLVDMATGALKGPLLACDKGKPEAALEVLTRLEVLPPAEQAGPSVRIGLAAQLGIPSSVRQRRGRLKRPTVRRRCGRAGQAETAGRRTPPVGRPSSQQEQA
jgi:hypothetical protein